LGVTTEEFKVALPKLIEQGFPPESPLFFGRRYWPRVKLFLDDRYGLAKDEKARLTRQMIRPEGPEVW
jgi:hypothetical protein